MQKAIVVLPCYNEEKDIASLVEKWMNIYVDFQNKGYELAVYCINDCSKDNTKAVIEGLCEKYPNKLFLINHEVNKGLGGVLDTGFNMFNKMGAKGDVFILMDGDDTHDPIYSLNMLDKIENCDCVIASRYCNESSTKGVPPVRLFMSFGARMYYTMMLQVENVKDYTCGYRMYSYDIVQKAIATYGEKFVEKRSFACMMEVLYKLSKVGARFSEIPFELRYDLKEGESKMKIAKTVKDSLITAFSLRFDK